MQKKSTVNDLPAVLPDVPSMGSGGLKKAGLLFTIMKVTLIQMTIAMIFSGVSIAFDNYAQEILKRKVSLEVKDVSLMEALNTIEQAAKVKFVYSPARINLYEKITLDVSGMKLGALLSELLTPRAIKFKVQEGDDYIVLIVDEKVDFARLLFEDPLEGEVTLANVSGTVRDAAGHSMPGVNVLQKGTTHGTTTDADGRYSFFVAEADAVLIFSFIGYVSQEVALNGRSVVDVTLVEDVQSLAEVVVVGYGTQGKRELTGSAVRADIDAFRESPNVNIAQSLHGTVPGLSIGQVNSAGQSPSIQIRGRSTLSGNRNVLVVLDGIIFSGSLNDLNPNDIESIDVLKDASSKSIYGAQAANGVLIITTRQGKESTKPVFNYSGSYTTQNPAFDLELQTREQNIQRIFDMSWKLVNQAPDYTERIPGTTLEGTPIFGYLLDLANSGQDYDWLENTTAPGYISSHNLSVQGKNGNLSYFISGGYTKQQGYILNDEFERFSTRLNISNKITNWFEMGVQAFGSFSDYSGSSPDLDLITRMTPMSVPYDENGEIIVNPMGDVHINPFLLALSNDFDKRNNLFANYFASIDLPFVPGLNYRLNFGNNYSWDRHYFSNEYVGATKIGNAYKQNSNSYDYTLDNILSYKRSIKRHSVNLTLLSGLRKRSGESTYANARNFASIRLGYNDLSSGEIRDITSSAGQENYSYQMARVNYEFASRYLITATIRRDGFSGFAKNEKTAFFPSIGLGWIISDESFLQADWLQNLKLRTSYGANGNLTNPYSSLAKVEVYPAYVFGEGSSTYYGQRVTSLGNANLTWEVTKGFNYGIDFSILRNRLSGSIDYYSTTTNDLLYDVTIPRVTGFNVIKSNVGEINNSGVELLLNYDIVSRKDFNWNINFNISSNKNKIVSLVGLDADGDGVEDDLIANNLFIGKSIGAVYTYESDGILQIGDDIPSGFSVGTHNIIDQNGDGILDANDRVIVGRTEPAYQFGVMNEVSYKNFTFRVFINSVQGGKDGYLGSMAPPSGWTNFDNLTRFNFIDIDYWTPNNPNAKYDIPGAATKIPYQHMESRSFVRIQDVILAYNVHSKFLDKLGLHSGKVFLTGKNLFTFTKWGGWDPETGDGLGRGGRPVLKGYSVGIDFSF